MLLTTWSRITRPIPFYVKKGNGSGYPRQLITYNWALSNKHMTSLTIAKQLMIGMISNFLLRMILLVKMRWYDFTIHVVVFIMSCDIVHGMCAPA